MIRTITALAISAAALISTTASAQTMATTSTSAATATSADEVGAGGASAALLLAYGSSGLKFGIGARGGYTFPQPTGPGHFYVGGLLSDHFVSNGNVFYIGPEGGYELPAGPVIVRPYIGLGLANEHGDSVTVEGITVGGESTTDFAFWLGGAVLYPVTSNIGVGADARVLLVDNDSAFIFSITGQYHF
jgi:hypothetical protein